MIEKKYQLSSAFPHNNLVDENKNQQTGCYRLILLMDEVPHQLIASLCSINSQQYELA